MIIFFCSPYLPQMYVSEWPFIEKGQEPFWYLLSPTVPHISKKESQSCNLKSGNFTLESAWYVTHLLSAAIWRSTLVSCLNRKFSWLGNWDAIERRKHSLSERNQQTNSTDYWTFLSSLSSLLNMISSNTWLSFLFLSCLHILVCPNMTHQIHSTLFQVLDIQNTK